MQTRILIWAIPVLLFVLGIFLRKTNTTSFLGLICWSVAVVFMCYFLLHYLRGNSWKLAKTLTTALTVALSVGMIVAAVTGCYIGVATAGEPETACQYIIVLGAKVNGTEPSRTLKERIDAAVAYLNEHQESIAVELETSEALEKDLEDDDKGGCIVIEGRTPVGATGYMETIEIMLSMFKVL